MPEPNTVNKALIIPNTGDLPGTWGSAALNPDFQAIDGILGGFATISLSSATTFALSVPSGSLTPGAGPTQSQNSLLKFTGTLTGNAIVQFAMPGFYIVHNLCTVGTFTIKLSPSAGGGNSVCAPPGRKAHVFYDGTDMDFVDMPEVGAALDLHGATTMPPWIAGCTVSPYLIKDGSVYNVSAYPQLAAVLGSTFGGNGATTFGVPDERSRARIALDTLSIATGTYAGRVTTAISGVNGTTMGAAGGDQSMQAHIHVNSLNESAHHHSVNYDNNGNLGTGGGGGIRFNTSASNTGDTLTNISLTNATTGAGGSQNMPPVIVSFLPLVKT